MIVGSSEMVVCSDTQLLYCSLTVMGVLLRSFVIKFVALSLVIDLNFCRYMSMASLDNSTLSFAYSSIHNCMPSLHHYHLA